MKLPAFAVRDDGRYHRYCWGCHAETVEPVTGRAAFACSSCGGEHPRTLVIDPAVSWWVDETGEYWHESAGVFVRHGDRFLFFERVFFPLRWTIPAGHVDTGEDPRTAAAREVKEEVGLDVPQAALSLLGIADMVGDSCWRGSDAHRWHTFVAEVSNPGDVVVLEEGWKPMWLTPAEALAKPLTVPVRRALEMYVIGGTA